MNAAPKAIAHHQIGAISQLLDETRNVPKIIAVVGVGHNDIDAACSLNPALERVPIPALLNLHQFCSRRPGDFGRAIGRSVISDNDFAPEARSL